MKYHGSSKALDKRLNDFKVEINNLFNEFKFFNDSYINKILSFTKQLLLCDVMVEENVNENQEVQKIESIVEEIIQFLKDIDNIKDIWNEYNFWQELNLFLFYWYDIFIIFKNNNQKLNLELNRLSKEIKIFIDKWKTDFSIEFIINISFMLFKPKVEILEYLKILSKRYENTNNSDLIENLIDLLSVKQINPQIFNVPNKKIELELCLIILIIRFGTYDYIKLSNKILDQKIKELWKEIIRRKDKEECKSYIRDWLCVKYLQFILLKKMACIETIIQEELPYFSLPSRKFERLIYWIIKINHKWKNVQWRGAAGKERGKDIFANKKKNNKVWIIQAKRTKSFGPSDLNYEFLKVKSELEEYDSEGYLAFIAKNATDRLRKAGENLQKEYNYKIKIKDSEDLNYIIKQNPILLKEFFNYEIN